MAYIIDENGDIVFSGFETGIAVSPHKGIANIQNANISTETGEVMASYGRTQQSQVVISAGTLTQFNTSTVSVSGGTLVVGSWITATQTAIGLTSGTRYYVLNKNANNFQLSATFSQSSSDIITGLTSGTCTFTTYADLGVATASATEKYTDSTNTVQYRYYILDNNGHVWVRDTFTLGSVSTPLWFLPDPATYGTSSSANGLAVLNGYLLMFIENKVYAKLTSILGSVVSGNFMSIASAILNTPYGSKNSHATTQTSNNLCCYCDGDIIGSILPASDNYTGALNANIWSYGTITSIDGSGNMTIGTKIGGDNPVVGQMMTLTSSGTQPSTVTVNIIYYVTAVSIGATTTFRISNTVGGADKTPTIGTGTLYFNSFNPIAAADTAGAKYNYLSSWLGNSVTSYLNFSDKSQSIVSINTTVLVGCDSNILYVIDTTSKSGGVQSVLTLPENNAVNLLNVNNMTYIFAGSKGNIYVSNGSSVAAVITVPDYCAGIAGTPSSYIEPYFTWGGAMFLRGRLYFSILDQTSSKAGNCGGVWSFIPNNASFIQEDTGLSLRLENQNSYGTYNGYSTVLLESQQQRALGPQFWSAWSSDITSITYGIDFTATTPISNAIIETDLVPTGTVLKKKTFGQIEYKLSTSVDNDNGSVTMKYRQNSTSAFTSCGSPICDSSTPLSGYFPVNFEKGQWIQLQATLVPETSPTSTFIRLTEIRIR